MQSHTAADTFLTPLPPFAISSMQVRKLSGTSATGYSRDGLENRLNTAFFELDKKIEITLEGCVLAERARKDFEEVHTHEALGE